MKSLYMWGGVILILLLGGWWFIGQLAEKDVSPEDGDGVDTPSVLPDAEAAEVVGFAFIQDAIAAAPGEADDAAVLRMYQSLSLQAQQEVSAESISRDIAFFVGLQDVPDQGVSVENLEVHSTEAATLIVGLNYSGGPALRAIHMVIENGGWKVSGVETLDVYPPETSDTPPPASDDETVATTGSGCYIGGCSSQVCSDDPEVITTCEWREEYACYQNATCERQASGECGWTQTEALTSCLAAAGAARE